MPQAQGGKDCLLDGRSGGHGCCALGPARTGPNRKGSGCTRHPGGAPPCDATEGEPRHEVHGCAPECGAGPVRGLDGAERRLRLSARFPLFHLRARHGHRHHDRSDRAQARTRRARARRVRRCGRRAGGRVGQVALRRRHQDGARHWRPPPGRIQRPCVRLLQAARTRAGEAAGRDGPHLPRAVPRSRAAQGRVVRSRPDEGLARPDAAWRRECPGRASRLRDAAGPQSPTGPAAAN